MVTSSTRHRTRRPLSSTRRRLLVTGAALISGAAMTTAATAAPATTAPAPTSSSTASTASSATTPSDEAASAIDRSGKAGPDKPSISGSGRLYANDGQDRVFRFHASGLAVDGYPDEGVPGTTGRFLVAHYADRSHESGVRFWGHVDCLVVGGRTATFTGVVDKAISFGEGVPDVSELEGVRRGFSVYDAGPGRPDRLGFSWFMDPGDLTSSQKCQGPAPFAYVDKGNFRAVEWLPPESVPEGSR